MWGGQRWEEKWTEEEKGTETHGEERKWSTGKIKKNWWCGSQNEIKSNFMDVESLKLKSIEIAIIQFAIAKTCTDGDALRRR